MAADSAPPAASSSSPGQFVPEVLPTPEPNLVEVNNEMKRRLAAVERLLTNERAENTKLQAYIRKMEENPFFMVLSNLDAGTVLREAGEELTTVTAAVRRLQTKGTFTLSLAIKPFKGEALLFVPEIKSKPPKDAAAPGVFYSDDNGTLSRQDRRQPELNLGKNSRGDREGGKDEEDGGGGEQQDGEISDDDMRLAQGVVDDMDQFPNISHLQRALGWGYTKAARVHERLKAVTR